jgi:GT2 family glycosyltransferase
MTTERALPPPLKLSVCIITYRRPALLQKCLNCIAPGHQTLDPSFYEVIVSDDCPEQSARLVVQASGFAKWIQGPSSGIAANRNNAASEATGDWIVFVDDDELPALSWLAAIHSEASAGRWDVIEGRVDPLDYPDSIFWYAPTVRAGGLFCTANLAMKRELFTSLGGFDTRLKVSHEDIDLGNRIQKAGFRSTFLDTAVVIHPARKMNLTSVFQKAIQQQCQSYLLPSLNLRTGWRSAPIIFLWSLKFLVRSFRIQASVVGFKRWKRFAMETVIRTICCPVACLRLILC